jgi:hypothetical protein
MFTAYFDGIRFAIDVQRVVAARLAILARGDMSAAREANRMIAEKAAAMAEVQLAAGTAVLRGASIPTAAARSLKPIRRRVRANRRRLCRRRGRA